MKTNLFILGVLGIGLGMTILYHVHVPHETDQLAVEKEVLNRLYATEIDPYTGISLGKNINIKCEGTGFGWFFRVKHSVLQYDLDPPRNAKSNIPIINFVWLGTELVSLDEPDITNMVLESLTEVNGCLIKHKDSFSDKRQETIRHYKNIWNNRNKKEDI